MPRQNGSLELSDLEKGQILAFKTVGKSFAEIARLLNRHESTIRKRWETICQLEEHDANAQRQPKRGRKRKGTDRDDRQIVLAVKRNRFISASVLQKELSGVGNISLSTIRARIRECGDFNSYWAARKPFISGKNKKKRMQWAREHLNWTHEDWRKVLWSDESPYVLRFNGKVRVWRLHNERYSPQCCNATVKHDEKIMVWGAFGAHGVGILHRIHGIMDRYVYSDILDNCMLPSADKLFGQENYFFQQDNDPKHTSNHCKQWLLDNNVPTFWWPAQSPDLNPIENLWSILDQQTKHRKVNNKDQLFEAIKKAWEDLPVALLNRLVESMPRRCQAVIDSDGWPTKY
jgi:transposase